MKSQEIKDIALKFFTIHGYEGASLSQIADNVGMKKQSLYAHFKGKDDLFLQVLQDAKEAEVSSKLNYLSKVGTQNPKEDLFGYLQLVIDLFQQSEQLKFWLRMSFFRLSIWRQPLMRKYSTRKIRFKPYSKANFMIGSRRKPLGKI